MEQDFCAGPCVCLPALIADLLILSARVGSLARGTSVFDTVPCTSLLFEAFTIVCSCINSCY